jgi:hypothetical protein
MTRANLEVRAEQESSRNRTAPKGFVVVPCAYEHCHVSGKNLDRVQVLVPVGLYEQIQRAKQKSNGHGYDPNLLCRYHEGRVNGRKYRFYVDQHASIFDTWNCQDNW